MRISKYILLMFLLAVSCYAIRLGPSVRYMIFTPTPIPGSPSYESCSSRLMFDESSLILPGFTVEAPFPYGLTASLDVHWRRYDPNFVSAPDSSGYSVERRGSLSVFDFGAGKPLGDFILRTGVDLQYYSEEWLNPVSGDLESIDSLAAGPFLNVSSEIPIFHISFSADMGIVFPNFDDVQGWIDLSVLLP
jgi:hypothetical protein